LEVDLRETPRQMIRGVFSGLLDLVYPPFCVVCGEAGEDHLCAKCVEKIDLIGKQHCRTCGMPTEHFRCTDCEVREYTFENAASAGVYDGVLRKAIHSLKYDRRAMLAGPLADLMARCYPDTYLSGRVDVVVPVPIHSSRLVERGFNQARELAEGFARKVRLPVADGALVKTRRTRHQVDLPQDERYVNVKGVFFVKRPAQIAGKRVLLIDDVFTTGSTLNESAQALRDAGAASVCAYTLARSI